MRPLPNINEQQHTEPAYRIISLSPDHLQDFIEFFEGIHFKEHPDWSACYCYSFHFTGSADQWIAEKNRSAVCELVRSQKMSGYLAYLGDVTVGWCNANDRLNYQRLKTHYTLYLPEEQKICSIVCFLVHPGYRRRGIAEAILDRIEADYAAAGYSWLEAYPGKGKRSSEGHYMGPPAMYKKHGFTIMAEYADYYVVRKKLN